MLHNKEKDPKVDKKVIKTVAGFRSQWMSSAGEAPRRAFFRPWNTKTTSSCSDNYATRMHIVGRYE